MTNSQMFVCYVFINAVKHNIRFFTKFVDPKTILTKITFPCISVTYIYKKMVNGTTD